MLGWLAGSRGFGAALLRSQGRAQGRVPAWSLNGTCKPTLFPSSLTLLLGLLVAGIREYAARGGASIHALTEEEVVAWVAGDSPQPPHVVPVREP